MDIGVTKLLEGDLLKDLGYEKKVICLGNDHVPLESVLECR